MATLAVWAPFLPWQVRFEIESIWPIAVGLLLAGLVMLTVRHRPERNQAPADIWVLLVRRTRGLRRAASSPRWPFERPRLDRDWGFTAPRAAEVSLQGAGLRWLTVLAALLAAMLLPG